MSSGLTVLEADVVQGWEGSGREAVLEALGPTDTMNHYVGTGLCGQVSHTELSDSVNLEFLQAASRHQSAHDLTESLIWRLHLYPVVSSPSSKVVENSL